MDELEALRELFSTPEPPSEAVVHRHKEMLMDHIESSGERPTSSPINSASIDEGHHETIHGGTGIVSDTSAGGRSRSASRSRRVAVIVGIPVVAIALAAATWAVLRTEATSAQSYSCVTDGVFSIMPNYGESPIEQCADLWASGQMVTGVTEVPPLVGCIDGIGAVMVIEGSDDSACAAAGMAPWTPDPAYADAGEAIRDARISFHDRAIATGNRCVTVDDWRDALAEQPGTRGWRITVDQIEPSRHCYDPGPIDPTTRTIELIGVPGDDSLGCDPRTGC